MNAFSRQPASKMRVKNVEEGSPAASTGMLKKGQLIDSINGRIMERMDPRLILGDSIAKAEATDGVVKLMVRENEDAMPEAVVVKIPVLGAYSETWPLNCKKVRPHRARHGRVVEGDRCQRHGTGTRRS